jgi:two-component system chemotaxis response regulator CheY
VLIADDDDVARALLKAALISIGMRVVGEVRDGKAALSDFQRLRPDVICLDIEMPEMKGLEVLSKIRREAPNAFVFLISAFATAQNVRGAMQLRADGIIAKPFNKDKVTGEIQRAFARRQLKK